MSHQPVFVIQVGGQLSQIQACNQESVILDDKEQGIASLKLGKITKYRISQFRSHCTVPVQIKICKI